LPLHSGLYVTSTLCDVVVSEECNCTQLDIQQPEGLSFFMQEIKNYVSVRIRETYTSRNPQFISLLRVNQSSCNAGLDIIWHMKLTLKRKLILTGFADAVNASLLLVPPCCRESVYLVMQSHSMRNKPWWIMLHIANGSTSITRGSEHTLCVQFSEELYSRLQVLVETVVSSNTSALHQAVPLRGEFCPVMISCSPCNIIIKHTPREPVYKHYTLHIGYKEWGPPPSTSPFLTSIRQIPLTRNDTR